MSPKTQAQGWWILSRCKTDEKEPYYLITNGKAIKKVSPLQICSLLSQQHVEAFEQSVLAVETYLNGNGMIERKNSVEQNVFKLTPRFREQAKQWFQDQQARKQGTKRGAPPGFIDSDSEDEAQEDTDAGTQGRKVYISVSVKASVNFFAWVVQGPHLCLHCNKVMDVDLTTSAFGDLTKIVEQLSKPSAASRPSKNPEAQLRIAFRGMQQAQKQTDEENARLKARLVDSKIVKGGEIDRLTSENEALTARLRELENLPKQLATLREERDRALHAFNQEKDDAAAREADATEAFERRVLAIEDAAQEKVKRLEEDLGRFEAYECDTNDRLFQVQDQLTRSEESAQKLYGQVQELKARLSEATPDNTPGQDTVMIDTPPATQPDALLVEAFEASKQREAKLGDEIKLLRRSIDEQKAGSVRQLRSEATKRTDLEAKLSSQTAECTHLHTQLQTCETQTISLLSRISQFNALLRSLPLLPSLPSEEPVPEVSVAREYALEATLPLDLHTPTATSSSRSATPATAAANVSHAQTSVRPADSTTLLRDENADLRARLTALEVRATDLQASVEQYSDQHAEYMLAAITADVMALDLAFSLYHIVPRLLLRKEGEEATGEKGTAVLVAVLARQYEVRREQIRGRLDHFFREEGKGEEASRLVGALGREEWEGVAPFVRSEANGSQRLDGRVGDDSGDEVDENVEIVEVGWPEGWQRSAERREWVEGVLGEVKRLLGL
ncbi:hypothetical protein LTS18_008449 [Coniosporium uncinatum]|uniref:Uncharacterized protein n=1 Tax=Coniosporium uncinatum TaxID=93489 RepID=A0ACC3DX46_9PEZI|nr:hypothetical protein LTS18_008449 [Coniosporium uncinatum]